jgi:hypothetical protein
MEGGMKNTAMPPKASDHTSDALPTPTELRDEARRLKQAATNETNKIQRRALLARALELAQLAEKIAREGAGGPTK